MGTEMEVGKVTDFFSRAVVAAVDLIDSLKAGDRIRIKGHTTDLEMVVESMQIHNVNVAQAGRGDSVGLKVPDRVRRGDLVFKVLA